jgi:hypothetical protein
VRKNSILLGCFLSLFFFRCGETIPLDDVNAIFPEVQNINNLENTDFTTTLESQFDPTKNCIYAATIPLAWNELRNTIGGPLVNFDNSILEEINKTTSYRNVLKKNEYNTRVEVDGAQVKASAYFKKSLPFEEPLTKFGEPMNFNSSDVQSFGFWSYCDDSKINYYNSDYDFSISLFPVDKQHEIILIMYGGKAEFTSFESYLQRYQSRSKTERTDKNNWRFQYYDEDKVQIPVIEFHLEKSFDNIIGSTFFSSDKKYQLTQLYQRNAFILDENGAEVESYAEAAADAADGFVKKPEPKQMIFNKPFVVFLKRYGVTKPYFAAYIQNEEILKKFIH